MKHHTTVGIDIGTSITRVVVAEASSRDGELPRVLGVGIAETRGMRHGYIVGHDEIVTTLKRAVRDAEKDSGERIKSASLCIGGIGLESVYGNGTSITTRADGILTKLDIEHAIADAEQTLDLKNKVILHAFPVSFKVDGRELPTRPEGIHGTRLEVKTLFVTCFQQHLDDLLAAVNDAGIKVTSFTATPIATQKLLLTDLQRNFGCTLIDIGAETVSVSIFENNTLSSLHVFGIGSLDITKDIALGLRITPEEAESIKLGVVSFTNVPKKKLDEIIEARLSDIFELIDKYLRKIGRSGLLPAGAVIIGGGSHMSMIEDVAKSMLKIPVRVGYTELTGIRGPIKDQRFIVAYGVATSGVEQTTKSKSRPGSGGNDGDGFAAVIKDFFKQLLP
jgi:cell division protein FtsA